MVADEKPHPGVELSKRVEQQLDDMGAGFAADRARKLAAHEQAVRDRYEREGKAYPGTQLEQRDRLERERGPQR